MAQAESGKTGMPGKIEVPSKSPLAALCHMQTGIQNSQTANKKMGSRNPMFFCEFSTRHLIRDLLGGIGPDLTQRRVIMGDGHELLDGGVEVHGDDDFVDELGGFWADDAGSEDLAGFLVSEHLDEAGGFTHDHGFAVIVEGITGFEEGCVLFFELFGGGTDDGHLRVGKNAEEGEAVVDGFIGGFAVNELCSVACSDPTKS